MDKQRILSKLRVLRTENMYSSFVYQGINKAIELIENEPDEDEDDVK